MAVMIGSIEGFESKKFEKKSENFFLFHLKWFIRIMGKSKALFLSASIYAVTRWRKIRYIY